MSEETPIKVTRDGKGVLLSWQGFAAVLGAVSIAVIAYADIKNELRNTREAVSELKTDTKVIRKDVDAIKLRFNVVTLAPLAAAPAQSDTAGP